MVFAFGELSGAIKYAKTATNPHKTIYQKLNMPILFLANFLKAN